MSNGLFGAACDDDEELDELNDMMAEDACMAPSMP